MKRSARILVVDDNIDLLNTFALILKRKGYIIETAEDGEQAIEKYSAQKFDVVLMDVVMPKINGIDALHKMKEINPQVRIILMTAYCEEEKLDQVIANGEAYSAMYKPINIAKLMELLGEITKDPSVMVVDDDDDFRRSLAGVLEVNGYRVTQAASGHQAIGIVRQQAVDIAFVDIKMPSMDGFTVSVRLKEINPNMMIVMMTGYRDEVRTLVDDALQKGVKKCLYKPFRLEEIKELVEQTI